MMISTTFRKTTADQFKTITNGIDDRISIIRHESTGFYNITKMIKVVLNLKREEAELGGVTSNSIPKKKVQHWFDNQDTQKLLQECKRQNPRFESVFYKIKAGTPVQFEGTYVHKRLYDHFMMWLDCCYAMRVSEILDKTHQEAQEELERRLLQKDEALKEKDDALNKKDDVITRLQEDLAAFRAEATAKLNEITEQNKETHLQNCALKATADDQRSDIKKLIRFTDNISIKKDNAIAVAEDSRNQTLALSEVALHQHERMYQMCQEPVLNPSNPSLVQGNAWFYRRNADRSIDLVLKVGQRRTVMNFLQRYVGWKQLVEFHLYGSGVNYRIAIKEALKRHVATLIESANRSVQRTTEKATSYIEKYQKMEQQLAVAIAQKDGTVQPIASNNERPDGKLTREQKEAIKQEMAAHNQQLRAEHQQRLDALKAEIREHNRTVSKADVKRSIRSEVAALTAPVLFTSMKAWMAFKGTASAQPDEVSFKELNNRISKVEMEMKEAIPNVDRAREFFAALENVPELNMDTVFTSSRFAVELASSDTHLNSEHNDSELHIDEDTGVRTMVGFTWHNHPLIRFSKIREFLESFDEKAKDVPIVVDEELTSVHILEEILEFLKMEESEDKFEDIALKQLNEA